MSKNNKFYFTLLIYMIIFELFSISCLYNFCLNIQAVSLSNLPMKILSFWTSAGVNLFWVSTGPKKRFRSEFLAECNPLKEQEKQSQEQPPFWNLGETGNEWAAFGQQPHHCGLRENSWIHQFRVRFKWATYVSLDFLLFQA